MIYTKNKMAVGGIVLAISGINILLPNVGNLFDVWRIMFAVVTFVSGFTILAMGLAEYLD